MLTPEQEKWIAHLSDQDQVIILPLDPTAEEKFAVVKAKIQQVLCPETRVEHRGATSLGISGQDEIDVYVPVPESQFDALIEPLTAAFGSPRSRYPGERARFVMLVDGKHVDIFLINENCTGWINGTKFDTYLRAHPAVLEQYRLHKEAGHGLSMREYYRRKTIFFNQVLETAAAEEKSEC